MEKLVLRAPAKINWTLDVTGKRENGYHDVEMVMQTIELHDKIVVQKRERDIVLASSSRDIPLDAGNIAYRAAVSLRKYSGLQTGAQIYIYKNIPVAAGLAGGSTDAAAVLVGLNRLWRLNLSTEELMTLGAELGADVPFCIMGGTALASGIGEVLTPLPSAKAMRLILVKPSFGVSTKEVYGRLLWEKIEDRPDTQAVIQHLKDGNMMQVGKGLRNVLESITLALHPELAEIKRDIAKQGALGVLMSGSGPTLYGVFDKKENAEKAWLTLSKRYEQVILTSTHPKGIEIVEEDPDEEDKCIDFGRRQPEG